MAKKKVTFRKILEATDPDKIRENSCGGVLGCPHWYGLERNPPEKCDYPKGCKKCWNREFVDENEEK